MMDWTTAHLGSMEHLGDFYMSGAGSKGCATNKKTDKKLPGEEQFKTVVVNDAPIEKTISKDGVRIIQKFYYWEQFLDYVDWRGHEKYRRSQRPERELYFSPSGAATFQDAMKLARGGWAAITSQIKKAEFSTPSTLKKVNDFTHHYDIAGGAVNIGRYIAGMPDHMRRMIPDKEWVKPAGFKKILVRTTYSFDTPHDTIFEQGKIIYSAIESLEMANIRTELILEHDNAIPRLPCHNELAFYELYINIKKSEESFYPEKLMFVLTHPSFMRRLIFSELEKNPASIRNRFHFYYNPYHNNNPNEFGCGSFKNEYIPTLVNGNNMIYFDTGKPMCADSVNQMIQSVISEHNSKSY